MLFLFKQKPAYEMRISDWSSDVCSSDLRHHEVAPGITDQPLDVPLVVALSRTAIAIPDQVVGQEATEQCRTLACPVGQDLRHKAAVIVVDDRLRRRAEDEIGRASGRERVCQYVWISVVAVSLKKKTKMAEQQAKR